MRGKNGSKNEGRRGQKMKKKEEDLEIKDKDVGRRL